MYPRSWPGATSLAYSSSQSQETQIPCCQEALFGPIFPIFPGQTMDFRLQHVSNIWKAMMTLSYNLVIWNQFQCILWCVRFLLTQCNSIEPKIWHLFLRNLWTTPCRCFTCFTWWLIWGMMPAFEFLLQTLPKAQRTRGLSSSCQSNFLKSYHKFKHKSWSNFIFRISTKHQFQNLNKHQHLD